MKITTNEITIHKQIKDSDNFSSMLVDTTIPPLRTKNIPMAPYTIKIKPLIPNQNKTINIDNQNTTDMQNLNLNLDLNYSQKDNIFFTNELKKKSDTFQSQFNMAISSSNISDYSFSDDDPDEHLSKKNLNATNDVLTEEDLREKNRIAAKNWRTKKDKYLANLEATNDDFKRQVISLCCQIKALKVENEFLESELHFFQSLMSSIVKTSKDKQ